MEPREVDLEPRSQLMDFASSRARRFPEVRMAMNAVTILPLFQEILAHNNTIYLIIINNAGCERTENIRINEVTEEIHYIDIPLKLWMVRAGDGNQKP